MKPEKMMIRIGGLNVVTFENCAGDQATFNIPTAADTPSTDTVRVSEGVRRVVSEYGETLRKLSNE